MMSEFRALARLARRNVWRAPGRAALVVALIAVTVGAGVFVATGARTFEVTEADRQKARLGQADIALIIHGGDLEAQAADLERQAVGAGFDAPPAYVDELLSEAERLRREAALGLDDVARADRLASLLEQEFGADTTTYRRSSTWIDRQRAMVTLDLTDPLTSGILDLHNGRAPSSPDEVALSPAALDDLGARVGDQVNSIFVGGERTIVGEVRHPFEREHWVAVVPEPAFDDRPQFSSNLSHVSTRVLATGGPELLERGPLLAVDLRDPGVNVDSIRGQAVNDDFNPGIDLSEPEQLSTAVSGALMLEVAAVAAAAFAVGARRRVKEFGQLAVVGADGSHLRLLVLMESVVLAVVGALLGIAFGIGLSYALSPWWASQVNRWDNGIDWSVVDVFGPALVGVAAGLIAAWFPARRVGRMSPVQALAGRWTSASFSPRFASVGLVLIGGGLFFFAALIAIDAGGSVSDIHAVAVVLSLVAVFVGTAISAGPILAFAGRLAGRVPGLGRLVMRDSARQQVRSGASVAALLLVAGMPILVATIAISDERLERDNLYLGNEFVVVQDSARLVDSSGSPALEGLDVTSLAVEAIGQVGVVESQTAIRAGRADLELPSGGSARGLEASFIDDPSGLQLITVGIADPAIVEALRFDGAAVDALDRGEVVLGSSDLRDYSDAVLDRVTLNDTELEVGASSPAGANSYPLPGLWVSESTAELLDLGVAGGDGPGGDVLIRMASSLSEDQQRAIRLALFELVLESGRLEQIDAAVDDGTADDATVDYSILTEAVILGYEPGGLTSDQVVAIVLAGSIGLGLLIAMIGAALSAVEIDRELGTMVAIGAPPSVRRRFIGIQSGYHMAVAAILATPIAIAIVAVVFDADDYLNGVEAHWPALGCVLIAMPLIVAASMAALFRSGRPVVSRRLS